ncbi:MAG: glycerol-3-phosphate 1-O-acyltransferase [Planctomycetota bacterium]|nr:MAG: glycerol-3-phosphate 1-O-acyltransferase [Planctomycetota bacterium]
MSNTTNYLLSGAIAYVVGSIPCSLLLAKGVRGIDLRQHGSGNVGATNVARTMGWGWGSLALLLDALKGLLPVLLVPRLIAMQAGTMSHQAVLCGVAAVVGHTAPVWLGFKGGKGVATGLGVAAILAPWPTLCAFVVFAAVFAIQRIVSLGSILASITFFMAVMIQFWPNAFAENRWSLSAFAIAVPGMIVLRHTSNIGRLLRGEEQPLTTRPAVSSSEPENS